MKHFLIMTTIFSALIAGIVINAHHVKSICREIEADVKNLTASEEEFFGDFEKVKSKVLALNKKWYENHGFLSLSLHMAELERGCQAVAALKASVECGDFSLYTESKYELEALLSELDEGEKASFVYIF